MFFAGIGDEAMTPLDRRRGILTTRRPRAPRMQAGWVLISLLSPRRLTATPRLKVLFCSDRPVGERMRRQY
jgi:hypothetical protein